MCIRDRLDISPPSEDNLAEVKSFLNEVKALAYDLKSYGLDFLAPDTAGFKMISSLVVNKLPPRFVNLLIDKTLTNYPSINDVFENSSTLMKRLELMQM